MKQWILAIDGPAGTGKSTVAKQLARKLKYLYIDTGAMYRAVAWKAMEKGCDLDQAREIVSIARSYPVRLISSPRSGVKVFIDSQDVTPLIRSERVSKGAQLVSRFPGVRKILVNQQRKLGEKGGVVMEGRDIGTKVFPKAEFKFYLDASPEVRAERRAEEWVRMGKKVLRGQVYRSLLERDRSDSSRKASPLKKAWDAQWIDTTNLTVQEVCQVILKRVRQDKKSDEKD